MNTSFNKKIEHLFKEKSFSELTFSEKETVLTSLSAEEYDEIHTCIKNISLKNKKDTQNLSIPPNNKEQLLQHFRKKHQTQFSMPFTVPFIEISIPYFKPAFLTTCVLAFFVIATVMNKEKEDNYELTIEEFNKYTTLYEDHMESDYELDETTAFLMNM